MSNIDDEFENDFEFEDEEESAVQKKNFWLHALGIVLMVGGFIWLAVTFLSRNWLWTPALLSALLIIVGAFVHISNFKTTKEKALKTKLDSKTLTKRIVGYCIVRDTISIDTVLYTIIIRESLMYSMTRAEMISRRDEAIKGAADALKRSTYAPEANFYISVANSYGDKLGLPRVTR